MVRLAALFAAAPALDTGSCGLNRVPGAPHRGSVRAWAARA